jgi:hypothetical protein
MAVRIKLASIVPDDDHACGLEPLIGKFINEPRETTYVIARLTTARTTTDYAEGRVVPTLLAEMIEPITDPLGVARLEEMAGHARDRRRGTRQLPLDAES